jgi:hypothetical protein
LSDRAAFQYSAVASPGKEKIMGRKTNSFLEALLAIVLMAVGCGNAQRDATDAAINAAQSAVNAVKAEAEKYAPNQLQAAQNTLQSARDALSKGDYKAALNAAQDAANKAKDLATTSGAKRDEWSKQWSDLSASMPRSLDQIKARLNAYSHGHLPAGMDDAKLGDAKAAYEELKKKWEDASSSANQGNIGDAIKKASDAKELLAKLKDMLGIKQ